MENGEPIWMIGLGILDIETQLNSLKVKWIQRFFPSMLSGKISCCMN